MAKDKGKKSGEDDIKKSLDAICNARKDYVEERKLMKTKEMEERSAAKVRCAATEERRVLVEEKKMALRTPCGSWRKRRYSCLWTQAILVRSKKSMLS